MNPLLISLLMVFAVLTAAVLGRPLIRAAAPVLIRFPRLAVVCLGSSLALWLASVMAAGLFLAWSLSGPNPLPDSVAKVCQRCLEASNPFSAGFVMETGVPSAAFLLAPAGAGLLLVALGLRAVVQRRRSLQQTCRSLLPVGHRRVIDGHLVTVVEDPHPSAFALGRDRWGIVVTTGLLAALDPQELRAVLAHEAAHLRERHHLVLDLIGSITGPLRRVPLAAAIADAVPHYLEVSADNAARRRAGTRALASALLIMGEASSVQRTASDRTGSQRVLLAAGPERVRQLVAPENPRHGMLGALAMTAIMAVLILTSATAHGAALSAVVSGCVIGA
ncbi:Zn-dependent protease [Nesterenkonia sp. AN1]|uniref:Peptidase M48-like protein n=1 Tax=Nesterenkonia aurantiaca TaxID=1436010 RepID=A0A4V3EBX5_9MICC|nr:MULTISPECIES: M56 family metallopeptidase [Nesterenkonia]EXF24716.1 Zn-dependent protease [Nesterenkonia sp. AN1]TDS82942.1 peptidase M48-like protein [Nesterenkonia aurantiaca]